MPNLKDLNNFPNLEEMSPLQEHFQEAVELYLKGSCPLCLWPVFPGFKISVNSIKGERVLLILGLIWM